MYLKKIYLSFFAKITILSFLSLSFSHTLFISLKRLFFINWADQGGLVYIYFYNIFLSSFSLFARITIICFYLSHTLFLPLTHSFSLSLYLKARLKQATMYFVPAGTWFKPRLIFLIKEFSISVCLYFRFYISLPLSDASSSVFRCFCSCLSFLSSRRDMERQKRDNKD